MKQMTRSLLAILVLWLGVMRAPAAQPFVKTVVPVNPSGSHSVSIQAQEVGEDGTLWVAGIYSGVARFTPTLEITNAQSGTAVFLARQDPSGGWAWAKTLVRFANGDAFQVNDIAVLGTNVLVGGDVTTSGGSLRGWVALQDATSSGAVPTVGTFHGGTNATAYAGVNRVALGRNGEIYAAGRFRRLVTDGTTSVNGITPVIGTTYDQDLFIVRLNSQLRMSWAIRGGSWLQDLPAGHEARANGMLEEVVGLEVDAEGTVLVAFNAAGSNLVLARPVFLYHANGTLAQEFYTGYDASSATGFASGALVGMTGRISGAGTWLTVGAPEFNLRLDRVIHSAVQTWNSPARDAVLANGKFYVIGSYESPNTQHGYVVRTGADTVRPDGPVLYLKSTSTDPTLPANVEARGGKVFVSGTMGRTLRQYLVGLTDTSLGSVDDEITSLRASQFLAAFDADLNSLWMRTTTRPNDEGAPTEFQGRALAYDGLRQVVYWGGDFRDEERQLVLGEEDNPILFGPNKYRMAWLAALEEGGRYRERVRLVVNSEFGPILLNGAAIPSPLAEAILLRDTVVTVEVPVQFPVTLGPTNATRQRSTGFRIDGTVISGDANRHTFPLTTDTTMTFTWQTEYRLSIGSDHASAGLGGNAAAGAADPPIGVSWIRAGELVTAFVDGFVLPVEGTAVGTRYVVTGYDATGAAGTNRVFSQIATRQQVPQFTMTQPATILYRWKKQHRVQVSTTSEAVLSLPLARQVTSSGAEVARGNGSGEFWFDHGSIVQVMAPREDTTLRRQLRGWRNADPLEGMFPRIEYIAPDDAIPDADQVDVFLDAVLVGSRPYFGRSVTSFSGPVRVSWDYGDLVYRVDVALGSPVVLPTGVTVAAGQPPVAVRVVDAPPGSTSADMQVWDDVADRSYPLRPGIYYADWNDGSGGRVVTQVFAGFPGDPVPQATPARNFPGGPQFRHIADSAPESTPPVDLDPSDSDASQFLGLRYQTGSVLVVDDQYTATGPGRAVLLFSQATGGRAANGDLTRETLQVRVAETRAWDAATHWAGTPGMVKEGGTAVVGSAVSSAFDTAGLGTGYLIHPVANYNAELHQRARASGPIIPVNVPPPGSRAVSDQELVVVWFERVDGLLWPYQPQRYTNFAWPLRATGSNPPAGALKRIVIASRLGSEGLDHAGNPQPIFRAPRYRDVKIYQQPDPVLPGYNPNEEHARLYPSLIPGENGVSVPAAFALRNDLNVSAELIRTLPKRFQARDFTSDPYVLVQYLDTETGLPGMSVYEVQREDPATRDPRLTTLPGADTDSYEFRYRVRAGEPIQAPYPLNLVIGLTPCVGTVPVPYAQPTALPNGTWFEDLDPRQRTWFIDHKGQPWAVSGDSAMAARYLYPLASDFWHPEKMTGLTEPVTTGDCVAFLPAFDPARGLLGIYADDALTRTRPVEVRMATQWPEDAPVLKVGETLTYAGGEYAADHPEARGLPGVLGWAAGEIVFDSSNPSMSRIGPTNHATQFSARLFMPLVDRRVALSSALLPDALKPGSPGVRVEGDRWLFTQLPPSLQKRVYFEPLAKLRASDPPGVLGLRGWVNDRTLGDTDLTAAPPPVYVLEPNVLTPTERDLVAGLGGANAAWSAAVQSLADLSRNPARLDLNVDGSADTGWLVGLEAPVLYDATGLNPATDPRYAAPLRALGPGLALVTNPALLNAPSGTPGAYVTLAENNHPSLGAAPVSLHVVRIDPAERYRGALKTILPDNVFDEKITLRHTADFGGNVDQVAYSWWYREEDGTVRPGDVPPGVAPGPVWNPLGDTGGVAGRNQVDLQGNPSLLLSDQLFFVRYRHVGRSPSTPGAWSEWAGAANSSPRDLDNDGRPDLRAQLASGWIKRVLDAVNPYEARVRDFTRSDSPATASSMIQQLGGPYVGPVALNAAKDVVENVGLIELYETVLARARALSIDASQPVATPGVNAAILLASTRLADFYTLLGNEAWQDALDPTLAYGGDSVPAGSLTGARFCFENQLPSLLEEELALLRGTDESLGRPVFNRLFWNFTKGEGEVAYALNYQVRDVNQDGFIDESDALRLYPQGHGDAWGHYTLALRKRYDLLLHPRFAWESRAEFYNLLDVVLSVDFSDERKFAQTAAARAQAGAEIVSQTYRQRYVENPDGQWQGYLDTDTSRAWGVTEWARRAGQGAYFDWLAANALLVSSDTDPNRSPLQRLDRRSVPELAQISSALGAVQITLDQSNAGLNPLGLDPEVVPFDLDPTFLDVGSTAQVGRQPSQGSTHFEQVLERAVSALANAQAVFQHASEEKTRLREVADAGERLRREAVSQDLEFRNRLIEIFGTPYSGTVGPGKPYPAGYQGPDLNLFMYVDVNDITSDTVPAAAPSYFEEFVSFHALTNDVAEGFRDVATKYFMRDGEEADLSYEANTMVTLIGDDILRLRLPATAAAYTFVAPEDWGQRNAPGRLQTLVSEILQTQADLSLAVGDYDYLYKQIRDRIEVLRVRSEVEVANLEVMNSHYQTVKRLTGVIDGLRVVSASTQFGADLAAGIGDAIAASLPTAVGTSVDPSFLARGIAKSQGVGFQFGFRLTALISEQAADVAESSKEVLELRDEITSTRKDFEPEIAGMLTDIEELLVNEGVIRIKIFGIRERLRAQADQYRATLQEGIRLLEERTTANQRVAALSQENRYHDMAFRVARTGSLQRYRAAFDLAARYAYLAAKAYDYETNFDPNDRASALPLLEEIMRERALGEMDGSQPALRAGLSGILARLQDNFRAVEGRMGINNPQMDKTTFSLRTECFRVDTDAAWAARLAAARVPDLWAVPEYRRFCRPFAAREDGPQPGLVLRFGTEVRAGLNFFGKPLGPRDSAFDASVYSTRVRGAGVRFTGYPVELLARTPVVYLVPVGLDRMLIPDSANLQVRTWNVVDQVIPVPHATGAADLGRPNWIPMADSLNGTLGAIRRYSSFRAGIVEGDPELNVTRLVGRSVWNTDWMLIIPGLGLHAQPATGLDQLQANLTDIRLTLETYGYSGN